MVAVASLSLSLLWRLSLRLWHGCRLTGSDSESEWSSSEGGKQKFAFSGRSDPAAGHKKQRKKKSIPVAPPKLPSFESSLFPHASTNNGQSSPSSSSFPKLLNVHPDGSGKLLFILSLSFHPLVSDCLPVILYALLHFRSSQDRLLSLT